MDDIKEYINYKLYELDELDENYEEGKYQETEYYENSKQKRYLRQKNKDNKLDGASIYWFPDGTFQTLLIYKNGLRHGKSVQRIIKDKKEEDKKEEEEEYRYLYYNEGYLVE